MGLTTIPFRKIEEHTEDVFEAVTVIAKRARQIIGDRYIIEEERRREEENLEEIGGEEETAPSYDVDVEINREAFDETVKPTTQGLEEFLTGELKWDKQAMFDEEGQEEAPEK
ncbi:MAG: DNA-directed RNA polymerase subunit omega [Candidatus Marinimicrobia bacterium]|nr:DNA-directed RNA polymerase subunit omega [Candidatus Neomarinimicrobiota bacterium]MCF7850707.1 DNA-directed RNA polymerase subunit omega [Candidatus Neomarinimicrobiota bacterium]MCF7904908.1 DNA-directed RNA polymerase subunit omega [Candidatus Neomarinimicrobiota bacterium]